MKRCTICKQERPVTEFNKRKRSADGLQPHCRACNRERSQAYYAANNEHHKEVVTLRKTKTILENKQRIWDFLASHPCVDCGEDDPVVLEFDHLRDKDRAISSAVHNGWGWERLVREMKKCEVRCANCHRRKTAIDFSWYAGACPNG